MTQIQWLEKHGFEPVGSRGWELGHIELERHGPLKWRAAYDGVRGYGKTPQKALRDLLTYCVDAAARHRVSAARLEVAADTCAKVLK